MADNEDTVRAAAVAGVVAAVVSTAWSVVTATIGPLVMALCVSVFVSLWLYTRAAHYAERADKASALEKQMRYVARRIAVIWPDARLVHA